MNKIASSLHSEVQSAVDWTRQSAENTSIFYDAIEINFNDYLEKRKTINSVKCKELLRWSMDKITEIRFYIEVLFHQGISNYFHTTYVVRSSFPAASSCSLTLKNCSLGKIFNDHKEVIAETILIQNKSLTKIWFRKVGKNIWSIPRSKQKNI